MCSLDTNPVISPNILTLFYFVVNFPTFTLNQGSRIGFIFQNPIDRYHRPFLVQSRSKSASIIESAGSFVLIWRQNSQFIQMVCNVLCAHPVELQLEDFLHDARRVLVYVLDKALKLLHPFMPFITEELYQALPGSAETIMTQSWPTFDEAHNWADEEEAFEKVMDYIKAVRTMRTEMNVHPAKKTSMIIETADPAPFQSAEVYLAKFAFATDVTFTEKYEGSTDGMVQVSTHAARGFIPMMELIDRDKELARLNKEKAKAEKELAMFENQLNNPKFVERAPAALVEDIRNKHAKSQDKLANIEQSIKALG